MLAVTPASFSEGTTTTSTHFSAMERKWTFSHELLRHSILSDIPKEQRVGYHRAVGNFIEKMYDEDLRPPAKSPTAVLKLHRALSQ